MCGGGSKLRIFLLPSSFCLLFHSFLMEHFVIRLRNFILQCEYLTTAYLFLLKWNMTRKLTVLKRTIQWNLVPHNTMKPPALTTYKTFVQVKAAQLCPSLCNPMDYTVCGILWSRILKWVLCSLLQGIFPTQGLNPGLMHCMQFLYQLSHQRSP